MKNNHYKKLLSVLILLIPFLAKSQTFQWVHTGASEGFEYGNAIAVDDSGNSYIGGQIEYTALFDNGVSLTSGGKHDILVGKYSTDGTNQWLKRAGGLGGDLAWGIGVDAQHNLYVDGEFELTAGFGPGDSLTVSGANDGFLAKYSTTGNLLWYKRMGSSGDDKAKAIAVDAAGNSYVGGYFSNTGIFGSHSVNSSGGNDMFIAKYDNAGNCVWVKKAGGTQEDRTRGVTLDPFGNLIICGTYTTTLNFGGGVVLNNTQGTNSSFIAKYDTSGTLMWAKKADGCCDTVRYEAITSDLQGNSYVTGYFQDTARIGNIQLVAHGNYDIMVAKYDPNGNVVWARDEGGLYEDFGNGIKYDNRKNLVYVSGQVDFQGTFDTITVNTAGNRDIFLAAYDSSGRVQWVRTAGGADRDQGIAVDFDTLGNTYETGDFYTAADFGTHHVTGDTLADFFITKISAAAVTPPTVSASSLNSSVVGCSDIQLSWNSGNGASRIVIAHAGASVTAAPQTGVTYTANSVFGNGNDLGSGNFVVYNGTGNSVTVTGLSSGAQYSFEVVEYNGSAGTNSYLLTGAPTTTISASNYTINASASASSICIGSSDTLSVHSGTTFQWSPSAGLSSTIDSVVIATPTSSTVYNVTATNASGCTATTTVTVNINQLPGVDLPALNSVCNGAVPFILAGGTPTGGTYSGAGVSGGTFDPTQAGNGPHLITYTYTDNHGCTNADTSSITVNALPTVTLGSFNAICSNASAVTLSGGSPSGGTYSGPGVISGVFDPVIAGSGMQTIMYSYTSVTGCTGNATSTISVNVAPTVTLSSFAGVCANSPSQVLTGGSPSGGTYSGQNVSGGMFDPTNLSAGLYPITYSYTDANTCSGTATQDITVSSFPTLSLGNDSMVCADSHVTLTPGSGFSTYLWSTGASTPSIQVDSAGVGLNSHSYSVTVTNSFNCSNSDTVVVTFSICNFITAPISEMPACYIYPNPFKSTFTILSDKELQVRVYDVSGRLMIQDKCNGTLVTGENLSSGVYFVDVIFGTNKKTFQVIKTDN